MTKRKPHTFECCNCSWTGNSNNAHKVRFPGMTFLVCKCGGKLKERQEWHDYMKEESKRQKVLSCWGDFREKCD